MSLKTEAIKRFLTAARSLANQGLSKDAIMQFAKNEFGEITELFKKQIDNIFKRPASGIEKIKIKDEVFDDTVVKLPIDDQGKPFNPRDPLKQYDKPKKTDEFNLSEDDPLGDLEKIIKGEGDTGLPKKPRDEKYTGGMVDVEPNLSDIGHGSDALMARTRLLSPGAQGTTSTGLNYLLAEDNDNIRIPFSDGGQERKRFFKAGLAAGDDISPGTTTTGQFRGGDNNGGGGGDNNPPPPPEPVVTGVKPVTVIEKELDEPVEFNKFSGKLMTKRDMLNKKNFIDYVNRFGYESGKDGYADRLYDMYKEATGVMDRSELENIINSTSQNITNETDDVFKNINARTTSITVPENTDLNVRSSTIDDGDTFTRREVRPSGIFENGVFIGNTAPASLGVSTQGDYVQNLNPLFQKLFTESLNQGGRAGFSKGKLADAARRKFMKIAGTGMGGLAALKAGLINFAKDAGPKVEMVKETVSKTPEYFFDLVSKIKMFGKEGTPLSERMNTTYYKNFELTEDITTGDIRITKQKGDPDAPGYKEEVMEYSKGGNPMEDGVTVERYDEATLFPDMDGKMKDIEDGIEPDSIKEIMEEITEIKKADGGIARLLGE